MYKQLHLKLLLLLCMLVGAGTVSGQTTVTIWSEDFSGYAANEVPGGTIDLPHTGTVVEASGSLTYSCTGSGTKIYNESTGGGTKPEILVGKNKGTFQAIVPLNSIAGTITLKYKQNAKSLKATMTAGSLTATTIENSKAEQTLTLENVTVSLTSVTITFEATSSDNVRLDDIVLTGYKADIAISSIEFPDETVTVGYQETVTLSPTILPSNYTETVDWVSDNASVATVTSAGVVTGIAAGEAHITAKSHTNPSTIYDVCTVTVKAPVAVTGISMKSSTTLLLGGTETLEPIFTPNDATNKNVTWTSSDDTKVSVEDGVITALALTNGTPVSIIATTEDGGFTSTCDVTVNPIPVSAVSLNKATATLRVGKTTQLEATILPENATDQTASWESDDTDVATVSAAGLVTAKAVGTATITVKSNADNTKTASCTVTVLDGAIELSPGESIIFNNFSGAGGSYNNGADKSTDFTADDNNPYEWSGKNYMSSSGLQFKASEGTITSPTVKAPYGYQLELTTNSYVVDVYIGSSKQAAVSTKTWILPNNTAFTLTNNNSNAAKVTKVTITALKQDIATDVAIADPGTLAKGATGTFSGSSTDAAECTKSWTSSDASVIEITNAATGAYTATGRGTAKITYTVNPSDATNYRAVTAERNISVTAPVVITAGDVNIAYGASATAIGGSTSTGYAGTLAYKSSNTNIATVNASGDVTPVAVGTATITISAPADAANLYTAGEDKEVTVTVSAPEGTAVAPVATEETIENLNLKLSSLPSGWTQTTTNKDSFEGWSSNTTNGAVGSAFVSSTDTRYKGTYDLITSEFDLSEYASASVTFKHSGNYFGTPSEEALLLVKVGDAEPVQVPINTYFTNTSWAEKTNTTDLSAYAGKKIQLVFRYISDGTSSHTGTWDVKSLTIKGTKKQTVETTLNSSGYATYCSQYPLDFSDYETADFSAWQITNIKDNAITFKQITGKIKGGQGVLLKGEENADIEILCANSDNVLSTNLLEGTLAPTYFDTDAIYGLAGNTFMHNNAGTFKANKAYIPASVIDDAGSDATRAFTFVFVDPTTGITETQNVSAQEFGSIFNLAGQRISQPQKGVNIINGKKVLVK